jgi:PAS domain S-box-containing protein
MSKKQLPQENLAGLDELAELDSLIHQLSAMLIETSKRELALIDNTVDVILSLSDDLKVTAANAAVLEQWGWKQEQLSQTNIVDIVLAEHRKEFVDSLQAMRGKTGAQNFECTIVKAGGALAEMRWSVLWSEKEQSFFAIARDVGEERRMERLRKQFYAMVTHDLRTPLANIRMFFDMMEQGAYGTLNQAGANRIRKLTETVEFLNSLTSDLLELSRMQTQNLVLHVVKFSPDAMVDECCSMVEELAEKRKIKLEVKLVNPQTMSGDFLRLKQVLANFMSNAIKFSPDASTVTLIVESRDGMRRITVRDDGKNLSAEECKNVFEPYVQASTKGHGPTKGFGLGLAVAKTIVESHNGKIGAEVAEDGTRFWFEVPEHAEENPDACEA